MIPHTSIRWLCSIQGSVRSLGRHRRPLCSVKSHCICAETKKDAGMYKGFSLLLQGCTVRRGAQENGRTRWFRVGTQQQPRRHVSIYATCQGTYKSRWKFFAKFFLCRKFSTCFPTLLLYVVEINKIDPASVLTESTVTSYDAVYFLSLRCSVWSVLLN